MSLGDRAPEIGPDALDPIDHLPRWTWLFPVRHAALGLRPSAAPAVVFILTGILLGPSGVGVLGQGALQRFDVIVSVALAVLGVFIGLGAGNLVAAGTRPALLAATLQSTVTMLVVSIGLGFLLRRWGLPVPLEIPLFAAMIGVCSSTSAATRSRAPGRMSIAARISDLDDLPLVLLGTIAVGLASGQAIGRGIALSVLSAVLVALAAWLLFERARSEAERGVFVTGTVLLLGGTADYTGSSPLLSGFLAAMLWHRASGRADQVIASDIAKLQHPLVALLLILAGAWIEWTQAALWLAAPLVLLRYVGKIVGSLAASRIAGVPATLLATVLVPPGVLGIALALNIQQRLGSSGTLIVSAVTIAVIATEILALLLPVEAEQA